MAFTCGFFNSENGDRKYNAEQMSAIFDGIIADGVFTTIGDHLAVSAGTGMQVLVGTGKAWFDHTWNVNDAAYPLAIAASDVTLSRIDAIVLETNHSDSVRLNKLRVVQGTVASSPVKPTLTNSEKVHQHPLAWVTVAPGVTQIAASAIENAVGTSACPFVTGIIATTDIDDLFAQWNGEFDEWFDNLKAQLSDNVVANLQRQIDARVKIADKATADDVYNGTDDSKWVTPKSLSGSVLKIGDIQASGRNLETETNGKLLQCDGRLLSATAYPDLFNAIGNKWGESGRNFKQYISSSYSGNSSRAFEYVLAYAIDDNGDILTIHDYYGGPTVAIWADKNGTIKSKWTIHDNNYSNLYSCTCRFVNHQPLIVYGYENLFYVLYGTSASTSSGYQYRSIGNRRVSRFTLSKVDGNSIYIWSYLSNDYYDFCKYDYINKTISDMPVNDNTGVSSISNRFHSSTVFCLDYSLYFIWIAGVSESSAVLNMQTGVMSSLPISDPVHVALHQLTEKANLIIRRDDHTVYITNQSKNIGYFIEKVGSDIVVTQISYTTTLDMQCPQFIAPKKILFTGSKVNSSGEITCNLLDIEQGIVIDSVYQLPKWMPSNKLALVLSKEDYSFGQANTFFIPGYDVPSSGTSRIINWYGISDGTFPLPIDSALTAGNCLYIKALK